MRNPEFRFFMVGGTDTFRNQIAESCRRAYFSAKFGQVSGEIFIFPQSNQTTPKMNHAIVLWFLGRSSTISTASSMVAGRVNLPLVPVLAKECEALVVPVPTSTSTAPWKLLALAHLQSGLRLRKQLRELRDDFAERSSVVLFAKSYLQ